MVHNANQIALFFASYPHEEAIAGVTDHLTKFWERRMRQQIDEYVAARRSRACTSWCSRQSNSYGKSRRRKRIPDSD